MGQAVVLHKPTFPAVLESSKTVESIVKHNVGKIEFHRHFTRAFELDEFAIARVENELSRVNATFLVCPLQGWVVYANPKLV